MVREDHAPFLDPSSSPQKSTLRLTVEKFSRRRSRSIRISLQPYDRPHIIINYTVSTIAIVHASEPTVRVRRYLPPTFILPESIHLYI